MEELTKSFKEQNNEFAKQEKSFNIFSVLHEETDERRLHSRFISYLLSSNKEFLRLFLAEIGINDFEINDNCEVRPNKKDKSEYENIDILIRNKKQAIIIENKIFAGDSNSEKNGEEFPQLLGYSEKIQKKMGLSAENIKLVYLRLNKKHPSLFEKFEKEFESRLVCIEYTTHVQNWLDECKKTAKQELSEIISQYKNLVLKLTSDINQATKNQELLSKLLFENPEEVSKIAELKKDCFEVFKHVQWHTVADFLDELENALRTELNATIKEKPTPEDIAKVTHNQTGTSTTRLILKFTYKDIPLQIVSDNANGLTLGNLKDGKWGKFSDNVEVEKINFNKFENAETFHVIDNNYRKKIIAEIVEQISKKYDKLPNNFGN